MNPKTTPLSVGMKLYFRRKDRRNNYLSEIEEVTISKIAKKYLYVAEQPWHDKPINKETLCYDDKNHSQLDLKMYRTKQEIHDIVEKDKLWSKLVSYFGSHQSKPTLEQLRQVAAIILQLTTPTD